MGKFNNFEIEYFLNLLAPETSEFSFQTFGEGHQKHDEGLTAIHHGSIDNLAATLRDLNRSGAGIFVTVNETDGNGRKVENIKRIRAIWQDDDNGFEGEFPLEPSLIVQTSLGKYQRYWLVEDDWPCDGQGISEFNSVMERLVSDYGHDKGAKDVSRVLRVPGFYHNKGAPQLVDIVGGNEQRYTREQIIEAFPPVMRSTNPWSLTKVQPMPSNWENENARVIDALSVLSSDDREVWLTIGMALHHGFVGFLDEGYEIWTEWSKQSDKFDEANQLKSWESFSEGRSNPVTVASIYELARQHGWSDGSANVVELEKSELPYTWMDKGGELTALTIASMKTAFEAYGHRPSKQHWKGIEEIVKAVESMANGTLESNFYLSALPPGMGKTTSLIHSIRNLIQDDKCSDKSVIIFLSRLEEIQKLVDEMGLSERDYSVVTSRDEYNSKGNQNKRQARVMFTTQQMLESKCKQYNSFASMSDFIYTGDSFEGKGKPRDIRVWDEAIVPSMPITLGRLMLNKLLYELTPVDNDLATAIENFSIELRDISDGELVTIPDVGGALDESQARELFNDDSLKKIVTILWMLSGRTVRVKRDHTGNTALDYENILPDDLAPMLILDASGGLRKTYKFWSSERKGLEFLYSPTKKYSNLTIHHWNKAGGSSAYSKFRGQGRDQIDGVIKTIDDIPFGEKVLVIHHKENKRKGIPDIPDLIRKGVRKADALCLPWDGVDEHSDRVSFLNYGKHTATNEFSDYKYVILMGTFGYPTSVYEAMARGAKNISSREVVSTYDFNQLKLGEISHHLFQAACRGMVRKADGDDCPEYCHLYVIAYSNTGVPRMLSQIFPEAIIEKWEPIIKAGGKITKTIDYIKTLLTDDSGDLSIPKKELIENVIPQGGDTNKANFTKTVLKNDKFEKLLARDGIEFDLNKRDRVTVNKIVRK